MPEMPLIKLILSKGCPEKGKPGKDAGNNLQ
jgi:hypothetical protein